MYLKLLTFRIGESGVDRLAAVAAPVRVSGQAARARPDEDVPVRVQFGARDLCRRVAGTEGKVGQLLEADNLRKTYQKIRYNTNNLMVAGNNT